jgi:uncharacterized repeat protein (TIGR01451 family)
MKTAIRLVRIVFGAAIFAMTTLPLAAPASYSTSEPAPDADCLPKYPPPPVVKLMVRVPACAEPGQAIKYCICIENCSTAEAHHVVVKNALPENAKFVKSDPVPSKGAPELQWHLGTVGAGARREILLWLLPTNKEDVKNCARVQFEHGQCVVTRQAALPPGGRPPIIETVPNVPPEGATELDLEVKGPPENYANLPTKYVIIVTNKGKVKAINTQVRAFVSDKLKVKNVSAPGVDTKNLVEWNLGTLEPGATRALDLTLIALEKGEQCFSVALEADNGVKKEFKMCTKFVGVSAMTLEMFDRDDPVFIGHKTSYPITIQNQGSEPLTNIRVRAWVPDALKIDKSEPLYDKLEKVQGAMLIEFKVLPKIEVGYKVRYEVFVEAVREGVTVFKIDVLADQLDRAVVEQESTTIVDDREKVRVEKLNRTK